jgi:hypothetical protein
MHFSSVIHREDDSQEIMNHIRHLISTYFYLAMVVPVCLSTAGFGIIQATAVSQPRPEALPEH